MKITSNRIDTIGKNITVLEFVENERKEQERKLIKENKKELLC